MLSGFSLEETCESIKAIRSVPGRLQCFVGQNGCYVLDDAYNANLFSTTAAVDALLSLPAKRRIAFIGSMLELAEFSERDHRILGSKLATSVDMLITVGESAYYVADEVIKKGFPQQNLYCMDSVEDAISIIPSLSLDNQTAVLVKGSGAMRMDRITPNLLSIPIG
jgi:UDP-N-acetylmuramoyl-tripeptide--D-alanyl-D-alanine ligase